MMPAAPLVGAVTMRPPAAFSSFTARANRLTHSMALRVDPITLGLPSSCRLRCSRAARRLTCNPPGRMPSLRKPLSTHSRMAPQIRSRPSRTSASGRQAHSLAIISCATLKPWALHKASNCAALSNSYGSASAFASTAGASISACSTIKPPPTE
ncbi:hypothetical protein D3C81_1351440 [compost metagenome]